METKTSKTFEWISNQSLTPYVTIDSYNRLYVSKPARELMGLPEGKVRLIAGYDYANNRIVLAKPEIVKVTNIKPFNFDKRGYANARPFVERASLTDMPIRFLFSGRDYSQYPEGSYVFSKDVDSETDR